MANRWTCDPQKLGEWAVWEFSTFAPGQLRGSPGQPPVDENHVFQSDKFDGRWCVSKSCRVELVHGCFGTMHDGRAPGREYHIFWTRISCFLDENIIFSYPKRFTRYFDRRWCVPKSCRVDLVQGCFGTMHDGRAPLHGRRHK